MTALCDAEGCRAHRDRQRHNHVCHDLNATGETCWTCKVADWFIWFGGPLPAMIRCGRCDRGFNLSERLRATTSPSPRRDRSNT